MKICRVSVAPITKIFERFPQRDFHILSRLETYGHEIRQVRISPSSVLKFPYVTYPLGLVRAVPLLRSVDPDLIIADSIEAGVVAAVVARAKHVPFVFDFRDNYSYLHRRDYGYRHLGAIPLLERLIPRLADQVIVVDGRRHRFCVQAGARPDRLRLIPNGADTRLFRPGGKDPTLLARWGLSDRRVILFAGKVNRTLELDRVIAAMRVVVGRLADVQLVIVGDGTVLSELRDLSAALGLAGHLVFTGYRPYGEIPGLVRAADVCVYPLMSVAALSIFEYMACGKPVVIPNAAYDLSLPEGSCLPVQMTPAGFADGMIRLLTDPLLADRLATKAREVVEEQFSWDTLARAYEGALQDTVNGRPARP
jgi:glycosyltransferase involved in cell wall biosynthesis